MYRDILYQLQKNFFNFFLYICLILDTDSELLKDKEVSERDNKNHSSPSLSQIESSSANILQNELSVPTTDTDSRDNKYEKYLSNVSTESCERDQVHSVQNCFMVDSNMEEQLSSHFPHGNTVNSEEEMEITFQPSVYGEIGDKDINSFPNEGVLLLLFFFFTCYNINSFWICE